MSGYSGQQVNIRLDNGILINLTGADVPDLAATIGDFIEHVAPQLGALSESVGAVAAVGNAFPGSQVVSSSPAQPGPAAPAPAAPAPGGPETDRYGNTFEHNHPKAPQTQWGPAVLKRGTSKSGNSYARWTDPRDPYIPSNKGKAAPPDLWPGEFARGV